jgi:hypothetical protein
LAYQIPPIVKDANALTHIGDSFPHPQNFVNMSDDLALSLGEIAILALVDAGEAGHLDQLLLAEQPAEKAPIKAAIKPFVTNYVEGIGFQDEAIKNAIVAFERMRPELLSSAKSPQDNH